MAPVRIGLLALLVLGAGTARADEGWKRISNKHGVLYEKRAVPGSSYYEYRATLTLTSAAPARVRELVWHNVIESIPPTVKKRTVLKRTPTELVVYDEIHAPVVSDRDVVLRIQQLDLGDGTLAVRFDNITDTGPPPAKHYVRLPAVRGAWLFFPVGGGTRVTYVCYSEAGGSVPAALVRGTQEDQIVADITRGLHGLE